eukprot:Skav201322  [mRNA]  locus=scaffold4795:6104:6781:+ [translate_table: standard]
MAESASASDGEQDALQVKIAQVYAITVGRHVWHPDIQTAENQTYFKLDKFDRQLTKIVMGKGVHRHKKTNKEVVSMSTKAIWNDMLLIRKRACNVALKELLKSNMEQAGQEVPANHKFREARDDDRWLMPLGQVKMTLPAVAGRDELVVKALWQVKGALWLELNAENVLHCIHAIRDSEEAGPKSPKRKRRRKRGSQSATPPKARRPAAQAADNQPPAEDHAPQG